MIIKVNSGNGNLANYLIDGTSNSRDKEKISILEGNVKLTDSLSKSLNYKDSHFHFIISANGKRSNEDMREIHEDFKKELLHSYRDNEVNMLSILHQDTDNNSHIHIQIPKINLLTNTKLDLYYHKRDLQRFKKITEYLNLKYDEKPPSLNSQNNPTKNWAYNPNAVKNKLEKKEFESKFLDYLFENKHKFKSHEELLKHIGEEMNIKVNKVGYDYKKDDFYITIQHQKDLKAQRIFSLLFNNGKSKYIKDENGDKEYIKYDFENVPLEKQKKYIKQESLYKIKERLDAMQEVHRLRVDKRIGKSREEALKRLNSTDNEPLQLKPPKEIVLPLENTAHTYFSAIHEQKQEYQLLEELKQYNLAEIATRFYDYKSIEETDTYNIIEDKNTAQKLIVYNDEEENKYRYLHLNNHNKGGDLGTLLNQLKVKNIYLEMKALYNPIKMYLNIFKDLKVIGKIGLTLLASHYQESKSQKQQEPKINKKLSKNVPSPQIDLKPT